MQIASTFDSSLFVALVDSDQCVALSYCLEIYAPWIIAFVSP